MSYSDHHPFADENPDYDDRITFPEPPMEQAEVDQAMFDADREAMIDREAAVSAQLAAMIPEWERAGYDKLVAIVNGPDIEDEIPERDIDWELKAERENAR